MSDVGLLLECRPDLAGEMLVDGDYLLELVEHDDDVMAIASDPRRQFEQALDQLVRVALGFVPDELELWLGVFADRDPGRDRQAAEEVADSIERLLER